MPGIRTFCQQAELKKRTTEEILNEKNSYGAALYNLARERFIAHEVKKETWILAVNHSVGQAGLKKFTEGGFTVVSIPVLDHEHDGICLYAAQYNSLNVRKADLLALDGNYDQALKIIRLLKRFDNCGLSENIDLDSRLTLFERLKRGQETDAALEQLKRMTTNYGSSVFERIEFKPPTIVTNLLEVNIDAATSSEKQ